MSSKLKQKLKLTEADKEMYAAERGDNFRWVSALVASYSKIHLTEADKVPLYICEQISDIGQFAEMVYHGHLIETLLKNYSTLCRPGFPLEGYTALPGAILEKLVIGKVADLPAAVFWRPSHAQLFVTVCGTKSLWHALQDVRAVMTKHPVQGLVHTGFWSLYQGLRVQLRFALYEALRLRSKEPQGVSELVLTGHSMGGAIVSLLAIDIMRDLVACLDSRDEHDDPLIQAFEKPSGTALRLVTFGMPRSGDQQLVDHYHALVKQFQEKYGSDRWTEYAVRTYNDGVPALPPLMLGYRHFATRPLYATGRDLYYVPTSEREKTLFHVDGEPEETPTPPEPTDPAAPPVSTPSLFPLGGHNYYGGRELERFQRRVAWLEKADMSSGDGWEERYLALAQKRKS